jgi:hypothetical protein
MPLIYRESELQMPKVKTHRETNGAESHTFLTLETFTSYPPNMGHRNSDMGMRLTGIEPRSLSNERAPRFILEPRATRGEQQGLHAE